MLAMYLPARYGIETFISDAATRPAYQIREPAFVTLDLKDGKVRSPD